jgi:hypothetical protein
MRAAAAAALALLVLGGCANPGVIPVQEAGATENPATGPAVRIGEVLDRRDFQDFSGVAFTPTLAAGTDRSRAIARNTGPGGEAFDNVLLAPGESVESIAAEAVTRALRQAGFRVMGAQAEGATALRITIEKLWVVRRFDSPGGAAEAEIQLRIAGPIGGLDRGAVVSVRKLVARQGWLPSLWRITLEKGLDAVTEKAVPELEAARAAAGASSGMLPFRSRSVADSSR